MSYPGGWNWVFRNGVSRIEVDNHQKYSNWNKAQKVIWGGHLLMLY
jgi:hypothetical protein